jgi:hypothetical protein
MFEIGNTLRESRLRRGLDIADCEAATKIRAKYLRAMEEEQFDVLPGPTYIKGFLRTYAEHLELDGRLVVDENEARFTTRTDHAADDPARRRSRRRRNREGRMLAIAAGLVMTVAVAIWIGFADDPAPSPSAPAGQVTTVFSAVGPRSTYLEVRTGGPEGAELLPTGSLRAGTSRQFAALPPIWVRVGDGAGLRLTVDGRPITPPPGSSEFRILDGGELQPSVPR